MSHHPFHSTTYLRVPLRYPQYRTRLQCILYSIPAWCAVHKQGRGISGVLRRDGMEGEDVEFVGGNCSLSIMLLLQLIFDKIIRYKILLVILYGFLAWA